MKLEIDTDRAEITVDGTRRVSLWSDEGFELVTSLWVKSGWNQKHNYTFTWFGVPVIQLPEDMIRYQEVVCAVKPDVIVETGIAHGGSLVYSATLLKMLGRGRVVGVDIEIRPHNRARLEAHPLIGMITLLEGSSVDPAVVDRVKAQIRPGETVMVVLDSNHTRAHVAAELDAYAPLVSPGSYIVATDGIMRDLADTPRGAPDWTTDNPAQAARDFVAKNPDFVVEQPAWAFNESTLSKTITHWPDAWIRRIR